MNERGSVELYLLLLLILVLELGLYQLTRSLSEQVARSYEGLDPLAPEENLDFREFAALGRLWPAPAARLDFGADNQHERDAEALCYIVSRFGCASPGKSFQCK